MENFENTLADLRLQIDAADDKVLAALAVGDSVRTTGGFIGTVIDINDDMVIVEFGNNKNCRIPMVKEAIVEVEKPEDAVATANDTSDSKKK